MSNRTNTVTRRILAMKFASEFMLIYPLYPIMFGERGGVDATGIGILLAAIAALTVILEIPTGIIADKVSRKYILFCAIMSKAVGLAIWLSFPNFTGYLVGVIFLALSFSLESGAIQAYIYGTLGAEHKKYFGKFWSRVYAMMMLSWALAFIAATAVGVDYALILGLSITACIVALVICLSLPRDNVAFSKTEVKPKIFRSAVNHIAGTVRLKSLLVVGILVVALTVVTTEYMSPYYYQSGIALRWIALAMAAGNILGAIVFWTFHSWEPWFDKLKLPLAIIVPLLFVASFAGGTITLCLCFLLVVRFLRILQIQFESNVQYLSNEESRATISSIASFAANLIAGGIIVAVGLLATNDSILWPLRIALLGGIGLYVLLYLTGRWQSQR